VSDVIRVLVVDDHAIVREGIRQVLVSDAGISVVGEAANAELAIDMAVSLRPDVVLLDVTMPDASGLHVVTRLRELVSETRVLMLSVHGDTEYVLRSVRAGAHGYLRKDTTPATLRDAVRAVHRGGEFFSPDVAVHLTSAIRDAGTGQGPSGSSAGDDDPPVPAPRDAPAQRGALEQLTGRERDVLMRVARGLLNKEIAAELGISVRTVESHRESLTRKLGVRSVAGLTRLAIEHGLVE
jgi:two-component system, NarL family, nitrate/nitrite response regulator NarL